MYGVIKSPSIVLYWKEKNVNVGWVVKLLLVMYRKEPPDPCFVLFSYNYAKKMYEKNVAVSNLKNLEILKTRIRMLSRAGSESGPHVSDSLHTGFHGVAWLQTSTTWRTLSTTGSWWASSSVTTSFPTCPTCTSTRKISQNSRLSDVWWYICIP